MRVNMPVTDKEVELQQGQTIVSKTDLKGKVSYVNRDFLDISGFSEAELMGKNHNIVRHPDMPAAAFLDLWNKMKAGRPWTGFVKNRCKSGDFYWVNAQVTPIYKNGRVCEYMSVRHKPTSDQIKQSGELYKQINDGKVSLEPKGFAKWASWFKDLNVKAKFIGIMSIMAAVFAGTAFMSYQATGNLDQLMVQSVAFVSLILALYLLVSRTILKRLDTINQYFTMMMEGDYKFDIPIDTNDEVGKLLQALKATQIKLGYDIDEAKRMACEAGRIRTALDNVSTNVMVADNDYNIIYMNTTVREMFSNAEEDIRKDLPDFDASQLLGANIDVFHKDPAHQRKMLDTLKQRYQSELKIGGRTLRIVANPVFDVDGRRLGIAVEWTDRTLEVAVEAEVESIVNAAKAGNLSERIALEGKTGFFESLSSGINEMVDVCEKVVNDTVRVFGAMAEGGLTETIDADYAGSFGQLKQDANATINKLTEAISEIKSSADEVKTAATEITLGNTDLSQRTEEQAASLEETASSLEEMTGTVKQNADSARQANQFATSTRDQAQKGGEVVGNAVTAMSEINQSSKKISDIIGVIDEIAFQTNLLALNAAVEAARAGEQGRGFAVVASEVRNLAQRCAGAAKEIKTLINDSVQKVEEGSKLVDESGATLEEIVNSVKKVSDIIAEIAAASEEQSTGIDQINMAVAQMDEMTQQNAALVEEAAAASESMDEQASGLNNQMAFFDVGDSGQAGKVERRTTCRRSEERPWVEKPQTPSLPEPEAQAPKKVAAASGSDEEWDEF
jgi:methyl-accepting chemotaxis protein